MIEAIQFDRSKWDEIRTFTKNCAFSMVKRRCTKELAICRLKNKIIDHSQEWTVTEGDWIFKKNDIFGTFTNSAFISICEDA